MIHGGREDKNKSRIYVRFVVLVMRWPQVINFFYVIGFCDGSTNQPAKQHDTSHEWHTGGRMMKDNDGRGRIQGTLFNTDNISGVRLLVLLLLLLFSIRTCDLRMGSYCMTPVTIWSFVHPPCPCPLVTLEHGPHPCCVRLEIRNSRIKDWHVLGEWWPVPQGMGGSDIRNFKAEVNGYTAGKREKCIPFPVGRLYRQI